MSESSVHIQLVEKLAQWIAVNILSGDGGSIFIDHPESKPSNKPPTINGYIPDVFVSNVPKVGLVIGEAKTSQDLERQHTEEQITAFFEYCTHFERATFVFATPWPCTRFALSFLRRLQQRTGANKLLIFVIEQL